MKVLPFPCFYPNVSSYGLVLQTMKFRKKKYLLIIRTQLGSKIFLQKKIKCCYNAAIHVNFPHRLYSHRPTGDGGTPWWLKVAPIHPSVTAAFHFQSRRDSDCQMWEISHIRHSRAGRTLLRSRKECGRLWMLLGSAVQAGPHTLCGMCINSYKFLPEISSFVITCTYLFSPQMIIIFNSQQY